MADKGLHPRRWAAVIALAVSAVLLIGSPAYALGWTTVPTDNARGVNPTAA